jgi:archaemetzincin
MGHILSIQHCIAYRCVMNGSNSLQETDGQPIHLCPEDLKKVVWNVGCDAKKRYEDLEEFYRGHQFEAEAEFVRKVRLKTP